MEVVYYLHQNYMYNHIYKSSNINTFILISIGSLVVFSLRNCLFVPNVGRPVKPLLNQLWAVEFQALCLVEECNISLRGHASMPHMQHGHTTHLPCAISYVHIT